MCTAMTGGALGYGYNQVKKTKDEELVAKKEATETEQKKQSRAPTV
tara:strand:+ start:308 stop:445 length:138 start_codon:yes stop_codon:yes gene_type:complete